MNYIEQVDRPWGKYYVIHDEPNYKLKIIEVMSGHRLSYQYHENRSESWTIIEGEGTLTLDGKEIELHPGDNIKIQIFFHITDTGTLISIKTVFSYF